MKSLVQNLNIPKIDYNYCTKFRCEFIWGYTLILNFKIKFTVWNDFVTFNNSISSFRLTGQSHTLGQTVTLIVIRHRN